MRSHFFLIICIIGLFCIMAASENAGQSTEEVGLIRGIITDTANRSMPIPEANIHYSGRGGLQGNVVSDEAGNYLIPDLPPGAYALDVTAEGYAPRQGLSTAVLEGRESVFNIPLRPQPNFLGQITQNRIALVIFGFILGLVIGFLLAFMIKSK